MVLKTFVLNSVSVSVSVKHHSLSLFLSHPPPHPTPLPLSRQSNSLTLRISTTSAGRAGAANDVRATLSRSIALSIGVSSSVLPEPLALRLIHLALLSGQGWGGQ